jgi:ribonucleoside-diphosphate reductase alpha chain
MGMTKNPDIPFAKSIVDYIFRWLGQRFVTEQPEPQLHQTQVASGDAVSRIRARHNFEADPNTDSESLAEHHNPGKGSEGYMGIRSTSGFPAIPTDHAILQTDAPSCDQCGSITVRSGNCYLCYNCGNSMGCS